ncbi:DHHC family palmitoyl transferase [Cryptosporidium ubiquitum]|uniref:Palmitoyltransferase n=1 Tax=Cryptosporidium ubiquitum TaxID=857276 RepID=A0A1J4MG17_9CRYT|nr:DHHC family palmitoyl transferase [Cryptosporidium ubiquitum]OII71789.1 DHHC family palmitoyl transferase [Cryptosporidium ubiquitum]
MNVFPRPYWFVYDICGILCMTLTELLLLYSTLVLNIFFIKKLFHSGEYILFIFNLICCNFLYIICSFCHLSCSTTDPGVIPNNTDKGEILLPIELQTQTISIRSCAKCNNLKPPRTHHCSVCKRCIFKMDHHCPWINNCVGINNQKHFLLFLAYVFFFCVYSLILICFRFYRCISYPVPNSSDIDSFIGDQFLKSSAELLNNNLGTNEILYHDCNVTPISFIFGFSVIVESLIFGIFCMAMFVDQVICIVNNTTGIEHLKQEYLYSKKKSVYSLFIQVFGSKFSWRWFLPTMTRPPFTTNSFDISRFLDFELGDFMIDPECGFDCDQSRQGIIQSSDSLILIRRMKSNRLSCCFFCEGIDSTNMSIPNVSEDFSIFESDIRKIGDAKHDNIREILMDDLQRQT